MGYTNETELLMLPQWIATDKPDWLNDMNGAFRNIDSGFADVKGESSQASADASQALTTIGNINEQIMPMQNSINTNTQSITTLNNLIAQINSQNTWTELAITNINGSAPTLKAYYNPFIKCLNLFGRMDVAGGAIPNNPLFKIQGLNITTTRVLNTLLTQNPATSDIVPFQVQVSPDGSFKYINTGDQPDFTRLLLSEMLNVSAW